MGRKGKTKKSGEGGGGEEGGGRGKQGENLLPKDCLPRIFNNISFAFGEELLNNELA